MDDFDGLSGIVTGAGSNIGRAVTLRLAELGGNVLAVDLNESTAQETAELASEMRGTVLPHKADCTSGVEVKGYVDACLAKFGAIDFFHNNAGIVGVHKSIIDTTEEEWDRGMSIMLRSFFLGLHHVLPVMKAAGKGAVVNTGSLLSLKAAPNRSDYVVAKHGVMALSKTAAAEVAKDGIKVNCICPGPIEGPMMAESERLCNPDDPGFERRRFEQGTPMGRYGRTDEIADLVSYLLLPKVAYLTGAAIPIDGGIMTV